MLYTVESVKDVTLESAFFETKSAISNVVHEYEMSIMNEKYNFLCENGHEMAVYQVKEKKENFFMKAIHFIIKNIKEFWAKIKKWFHDLASKLKKKKGCEEAATQILAISDGVDDDYKKSEQKILALNPGNGAIPMGPVSDEKNDNANEKTANVDENIKKAQAEANSFMDKTKVKVSKASNMARTSVQKAIKNAENSGMSSKELEIFLDDIEFHKLSGNRANILAKNVKSGIDGGELRVSPRRHGAKRMNDQRKYELKDNPPAQKINKNISEKDIEHNKKLDGNKYRKVKADDYEYDEYDTPNGSGVKYNGKNYSRDQFEPVRYALSNGVPKNAVNKFMTPDIDTEKMHVIQQALMDPKTAKDKLIKKLRDPNVSAKRAKILLTNAQNEAAEMEGEFIDEDSIKLYDFEVPIV